MIINRRVAGLKDENKKLLNENESVRLEIIAIKNDAKI